MVLILRIILMVVLGIIICLAGIIFCLFSPRDPKNVSRFSNIFALVMAPIFGIKVIIRPFPELKPDGNYVYIANHQNNYDILAAGKVVQPGTVTIGKKSLVWIPFFGPLYWITGNILLDRDNKSKAHDTLGQVVNAIKAKNLSVWMFPEGTRSRGRGLLPFKTGAFRTAIAAGVPVVPICISDTHKIKLNRWNNGHVLVEMLSPIDTANLGKEEARALMEKCYQMMSEKITELNKAAHQLNQKSHN